MSATDDMAVAKARIADEAKQQTGSLDLSGLEIAALPEEIRALTALQALDLNETQVSDLTPLASLTALLSLSCRSTQVSDLTPLASLTVLQTLECDFTQVRDLTPLASLTALLSLDCDSTQVSDLTPLASLTALQSLNCNSTQVSDLTPLASLTALQSLTCGFTQVSDLTPLASLTALQSLTCGFTQVSDLTPLASLTALQSLYCSSTQVSDLTPLASLTALQSLYCGSTQVSDLTPLASLTALQSLYCGSTQVSDLTPLARLKALQTLECGSTQVSDLTPLASLTALQELNVSSCRLVTLPAFIMDKPDLQLIAQNAHVPGLPHGLLSKKGYDDCRPRVKAHYDDLADGTGELTEIKLFLLGNGGAGKTQICRWLCGETFDPNWISTHGIVTENVQERESIAASLHLKIWDFGGQDIYHGTHAMFLRGPAVLVPVWAKDREALKEYEHEGLTFRNHPLAYWIDVVAHQADPASPVLIVQTKCDEKAQEERRFPVPDETLQALPYVSELRFSARTGFGASTFEGALKDAIRWLRNPERLGIPKIGAVRLRVQRRLEAMRQTDMALPCEQRRHRLLTMSEFEAICSEAGGVASPALLLDYLDANGCVIYRPGMIRDSIVLDQSWALNAIYTVFDRKHVFGLVKKQDGRVSLANLADHVWQAPSDDEQKLLLSLMRACGMCFAHRRFGDSDDGTEEFIVPDLLPERNAVALKLQARWAEDRPAEFAVFRYALLHGGLIRSVMAEIGELAGILALYWRGGFFVFDADTRSRLLVEAVITEGWQGEIRARTQDGQAAILLQKAVRLIERGQARFSMQPASIERSAPAIELSEQETKISPVAEPRTKPDWYISYAWGDDTPEGRARAEIVDKLCAAAEAAGHRILRDRDQLSLGDSISAFMKRIGSGDRVFVILSEKFLRSPFCMFELSEVWRTSKQEGDAFLKRVKIFALPDATVSKPSDWVKWAAHWKSEFDELDALARQHGAALLGEHGHRRLRQMQTFYTQVSDILGTLADIVQPRTFEELKLYGFGDETPAVRPSRTWGAVISDHLR